MEKFVVVLVTSMKVEEECPKKAIDKAMDSFGKESPGVKREVHVYAGKRRVVSFELSRQDDSSSGPSFH
jgi:hypothetical protein